MKLVIEVEWNTHKPLHVDPDEDYFFAHELAEKYAKRLLTELRQARGTARITGLEVRDE